MNTAEEIFNHYGGGNRNLTFHQLKLCMIYLTGTNPTKLHLKSLVPNEPGSNIKSIIDFGVFKLIYNQINLKYKKVDLEQIYSCIDRSDKEYVTLKDMEDFYGSQIQIVKIKEFFRKIDKNQTGRVYKDEFLQIIKQYM